MSMNFESDFIVTCIKSAATTMQSLQNSSQEKQETLNLCRFCAVAIENGGSIDLLDNTAVYHEYLHMIEVLKIDYLNFNHLKLPKTICLDCHVQFKTAYNFFNRVRLSQTLLCVYCGDTDADYVNREPIDPNIVKIELEDETVSDDATNEEKSSPYATVPVEFDQAKQEKQVPLKSITLESLTPTKTENLNFSSTKLPMLTENVSESARKGLLQNSPNLTLVKTYESTSESELDEDRDNVKDGNVTPTNFGLPVSDSATDLRHQNLLRNILFDNLISGNSNPNENLLRNNEEKNFAEVPIESSQNLTNNEEINSLKATFGESSKDFMQLVPYSDIPVETEGSDNSWTSYPWACKHCTEKFQNMKEVREHSKVVHGKCYGYNCADCIDHFNMFYAFIEHVRQHRQGLRYYCQFCNLKCESQAQCSEHALSHWTSHKICALCGEMFEDAAALRRHRAAYKKARLPRRDYRKKPRLVAPSFKDNSVSPFGQTQEHGWNSYEWACLECCMRLSSLESLRAHVRDSHEKCFAMKCADCLTAVSYYRMFVAHVTAHRPYLKNYCQYCNEHFETFADQNKHVKDHMTGPQKPCDGCGEIFENKTLLLQHMRKYDTPRIRGTLTTEDLACDLCTKVFKTMGCFRIHQKTHSENRKRDHICDTCGKGFYNAATLRGHVVLHTEVRREVCELCKKEFKTKPQLRSHVLTHLDKVSAFTCDECGKTFRKKENLKCHMYNHMDVKLIECVVCGKGFKHKFQLKIHMNQHTGSRPYACKHCDKTFTNWANCNKHMLRKHGDTLAKTKLTNQGRLKINKETGTVEALRTDERAEQWVNEILKIDKAAPETDKKFIFRTT